MYQSYPDLDYDIIRICPNRPNTWGIAPNRGNEVVPADCEEICVMQPGFCGAPWKREKVLNYPLHQQNRTVNNDYLLLDSASYDVGKTRWRSVKTNCRWDLIFDPDTTCLKYGPDGTTSSIRIWGARHTNANGTHPTAQICLDKCDNDYPDDTTYVDYFPNSGT